MPTENRSSNTDIISVPRELAESAARWLEIHFEGPSAERSVADELRKALAQPAEQHQGEPVALPARKHSRVTDTHAEGWNACLDEIAKLGPLYASPAPVQQGEPVAYLDIGAGGYMDLGTDLTDEQLAALPKGRHMLGIVGTYGVDGYTAAPVAALSASAEPSAAG
ncbi:hypothetical protein NJF44_10450 [Pseudomonas guariconensis]|uniref:hypothetical protein n=1 Tax=Pseudomonas TaxID=286 RepID=UPI0020982F10|nr:MULTISPECIES: hypothetical protein [Pseudomonas]MCO7515760.1 hypothetical protein [Pseudomonas putida]MCO7605648.1 hypothetical protein [Pseudomonas guariconensis]